MWEGVEGKRAERKRRGPVAVRQQGSVDGSAGMRPTSDDIVAEDRDG